MKRLAPALFAIIALTLSPGAACAEVFGDAPAMNVAFARQNQALGNLLTLQHQLQVLQQLIRHERAVNNMIQTSIELGEKEPYIASPDRDLCQEVPANIPCAQAFDSLYEGYSAERKDLTPVATAAVPPPTLPDPLVAGSKVPSLEAAALPALPDAALIPEGSDIFWTDITCLGSNCTAVITPDPSNERARYRVSMGEELPDGSVITAISASGVSIKRGKKTISLEPAPKA